MLPEGERTQLVGSVPQPYYCDAPQFSWGCHSSGLVVLAVVMMMLAAVDLVMP